MSVFGEAATDDSPLVVMHNNPTPDRTDNLSVSSSEPSSNEEFLHCPGANPAGQDTSGPSKGFIGEASTTDDSSTVDSSVSSAEASPNEACWLNSTVSTEHCWGATAGGQDSSGPSKSTNAPLWPMSAESTEDPGGQDTSGESRIRTIDKNVL